MLTSSRVNMYVLIRHPPINDVKEPDFLVKFLSLPSSSSLFARAERNGKPKSALVFGCEKGGALVFGCEKGGDVM